ncbi:MAG: adenylate/guanylate cyclase domain-containing protein, partial [Planococcus donghaensis]
REISEVLASREREMGYRLQIKSLRERIEHMKLSDFLKELKEVQGLGEKLGKKPETVQDDIYLWKIVQYLFDNNEYELAFQVIVRQLTEELPSHYIVSSYRAVPVIKELGKEREYLNAVRYYIEHHNPSFEKILELRKNLKALDVEKELGYLPDLLIE